MIFSVSHKQKHTKLTGNQECCSQHHPSSLNRLNTDFQGAETSNPKDPKNQSAKHVECESLIDYTVEEKLWHDNQNKYLQQAQLAGGKFGKIKQTKMKKWKKEKTFMLVNVRFVVDDKPMDSKEWKTA